jgi:indolepyruvate ferredoxin oxidoreductase beta subunit
MVPQGEADFLVVLSADQVENNLQVLRKGGVLIPPDFVPESSLPNRRSLNVALLGALSHHLDIPVPVWLDSIRAALPERLHAVNEKAFEMGRAAARARAAA